MLAQVEGVGQAGRGALASGRGFSIFRQSGKNTLVMGAPVSQRGFSLPVGAGN